MELESISTVESEGVMSIRITIKNRLQQNDSYDLECNIASEVVVTGNLENKFQHFFMVIHPFINIPRGEKFLALFFLPVFIIFTAAQRGS